MNQIARGRSGVATLSRPLAGDSCNPGLVE